MPAVLHLVLAAGLALAFQAARDGRPTEAAVRTMTRDAQAEGGGDNSAVVLALDRRVRARWGDFESFPLSLVRRQDITIYLSTPYMGYRRAVIDHLRMRAPLREIGWSETAVVSVNPERLEAPDVAEVRVARNGRAVAPVRSLLRRMQFTDGSGGTASLHAGEVHFPMPAFAPGATVTVTAVPASGDPFVLTLDDGQLRQLK